MNVQELFVVITFCTGVRGQIVNPNATCPKFCKCVEKSVLCLNSGLSLVTSKFPNKTEKISLSFNKYDIFILLIVNI